MCTLKTPGDAKSAFRASSSRPEARQTRKATPKTMAEMPSGRSSVRSSRVKKWIGSASAHSKGRSRSPTQTWMPRSADRLSALRSATKASGQCTLVKRTKTSTTCGGEKGGRPCAPWGRRTHERFEGGQGGGEVGP